MELHVVFNYSARAGLREALGPDIAIGRFSDDLSYGPINPPEAVARRAWTNARLGFDNPDLTEDEQGFWPRVFDSSASRIAWFSRRNAREYCDFLEYLRRLDGLPTQIIDTTDARFDDGEFFRSTGAIPASHILSTDLLETAHEIGPDLRADYIALWKRLCAENSELRVLDRSLMLLSASLSFYDQQLLSLTGREWRPMARVVGDILADEAVGDLFLFSRLYELIDAEVLASRESGRSHPDVKLANP